MVDGHGEGVRRCGRGRLSGRQAGPAAPDGAGVEGVGDGGGGVTVDEEQVGPQALGDASAVIQAEAAGGGGGGCAQGLGGG